MLIEFWEALCGYDKWIPATATVTSANLEETHYTDRLGRDLYTYRSGDVLMWTDANGRQQRAFFRVPQGSPLYSLLGGETVPIRYNPAQPDQYYLRELLQTRVNTVAKRILIALILVAAGVGLAELRRSGHLLPAPSHFQDR